jgi:hypothetical protein
VKAEAGLMTSSQVPLLTILWLTAAKTETDGVEMTNTMLILRLSHFLTFPRMVEKLMSTTNGGIERSVGTSLMAHLHL